MNPFELAVPWSGPYPTTRLADLDFASDTIISEELKHPETLRRDGSLMVLKSHPDDIELKPLPDDHELVVVSIGYSVNGLVCPELLFFWVAIDDVLVPVFTARYSLRPGAPDDDIAYAVPCAFLAYWTDDDGCADPFPCRAPDQIPVRYFETASQQMIEMGAHRHQ